MTIQGRHLVEVCPVRGRRQTRRMLGELDERIPFPCRLLARAPPITLDHMLPLHLEVVLHPLEATRASISRGCGGTVNGLSGSGSSADS